MTDNHERDKQLGGPSHKSRLEDIAVESIHNGTVQRKALIRTGEVGEVATMNYAWLEAGQVLEEHDHPDCYEYYLFLNGLGTMKVSDEVMSVGKDDFVTVNPTEPHFLQADASSSLFFLTMRAFEKSA
jgi:quercetin dioxygenase-like cupin family protein